MNKYFKFKINFFCRSYVLLLLTAGFAAFGGCAASTPPAPPAPPAPLKPVVLEQLPIYAPESSDYKTSTVFVSVYGTGNNIFDAIADKLAQAFSVRGYGAVRFVFNDSINTADDRRACEKIVFVTSYSTRSAHLPTKNQVAYDITFSVSVMDQPQSGISQDMPTRNFIVYGRDIISSSQRSDMNRTTSKAIENAANNLFCIDSFRKALEADD